MPNMGQIVLIEPVAIKEPQPAVTMAVARVSRPGLDLDAKGSVGNATTTQDVNFAGTLRYAGFWAMARKYWRTGAYEMYHSLSKKKFVEALQRLVPDLRGEDITPGGAGVRAQAVRPYGSLLDDFSIVTGPDAIHVVNAPSPGATASLAIGRHIAGLAAETFRLG